MKEEMTMITEIEENNTVEAAENGSTTGEKIRAGTLITAAAIGIGFIGKLVVDGVKKLGQKRKDKKAIHEAEFVDCTDEQVDSEEESE
jgi:hypothetical protein